MGMTMNEALVAGTLNAAASLGHSDMYGSLEVGKYGDMGSHLHRRIASKLQLDDTYLNLGVPKVLSQNLYS